MIGPERAVRQLLALLSACSASRRKCATGSYRPSIGMIGGSTVAPEHASVEGAISAIVIGPRRDMGTGGGNTPKLTRHWRQLGWANRCCPVRDPFAPAG